MKRLFTSESVTEGHPDKVADQISDAILDALIEQDPDARVAVETLVTTGLAVVAGEVTTEAYVDIQDIVRRTILDIGYTRAKYGFDGETCGVVTSIHSQSPDIALGVNKALEAKEKNDDGDEFDKIGAGDQGMMFGYATNETPEFMPLPIVLAHQLAMRLSKVRKEKIVPFLRPDGKTQVTVEYSDDGKPMRIDTILISAQHDPNVTINELKEVLLEHVIKPTIPEQYWSDNIKILVNPTGRFVLGGPSADTGLTGRKIIVDTYGGWVPHGGGAFSGKDPTKVDRSAHYMARYVAKNVVAAGLADRFMIQVAYAIGKARPVSLMIDTFSTSKVDEEKLKDVIIQLFDFRPLAIINKLNLQRPIYKKTAAYGHFGRNDPDFTWESLDAVEELKRAFNI
ncbi:MULTISPECIES: methionine adenosyltransferase [Pseudothermotoga]|jgi:S-adenosylmethionine synthetase|uniref:S-adenosylmethionine synthase n=1 Tax=Pseudothermotoga lettingae (strain ATCC BAA-301 / DSM 14385 / NBRC 107922 / TMO) TaxID=416591 RepID=METK_PSELT|nr:MULTISPECIES: methionine adenosyltransferase [Pseudothermotoga]A8F5B8.1 RecName: Full=S-adenosylmethionine synthase; Short=AdoMet synthase; AltName: Full=MAT; AltName: Full=Methionine adenosyltransferase [Pseudothermotoga lettingae TMO]ABV33352.1 Methionine adenosyltransferase [Pseudothermotoga lettingae TMO]KUK21235.1 MAG: S-adenosylmethionine synthase [Pseudothermotoga lettingae]MDI3493998.1 S-adenosylmethionine synthetase [Pseudothermotoga sp.]MDK2884477.1 S-adenosylmethionine synthetase